MVNDQMVHSIMPVKDSIETAEKAIRAVMRTGHVLTVYDDYSTEANAAKLRTLQAELGFELIAIREHFDHPSPNYRWVLIDAQRKALADHVHLIIIESDVLVRSDTIDRLQQAVTEQTGLVAAVTTDEEGHVNFPYEYAKRYTADGVCTKRLSFCCTLLSHTFLAACNFEQLDARKNWYDVFISHQAREMGFTNILQISNPVVHQPHSSRPWKQLKYTHPLLYYWRKLTQHKDKI